MLDREPPCQMPFERLAKLSRIAGRKAFSNEAARERSETFMRPLVGAAPRTTRT